MDNLRIDKKDKFIIFHIEGGHGKNIIATAVIEALKKKYSEYKIIVVTAWEAPFLNNPNIYRVYTFGNLPYFYDNYIFDDTKIMRIDPYHTEDHIQQRKHLIETWCDLYDIPYNGEQPRLYVNSREIELAKDKIKPDLGKPILLLQTHGGMPNNQYSKKSWARDMPIETAQKLVNYLSKSYRILHLRLDEQPKLDGVERLSLPHRELYPIFMFAKKGIFIDSFAQHAAAALGLKSTVCWIANKPEIFGYEMHNNVLPSAEVKNYFNKYSYLEQYDISGQVQQFPFDTLNMFDIKELIKTI